jgi:hypothetical protein
MDLGFKIGVVTLKITSAAALVFTIAAFFAYSLLVPNQHIAFLAAGAPIPSSTFIAFVLLVVFVFLKWEKKI